MYSQRTAIVMKCENDDLHSVSPSPTYVYGSVIPIGYAQIAGSSYIV